MRPGIVGSWKSQPTWTNVFSSEFVALVEEILGEEGEGA